MRKRLRENTQLLVCKCCGGKVYDDTMVCMYCNTPYLKEKQGIKTTLEVVKPDIMSPNEMREKIGLKPI